MQRVKTLFPIVSIVILAGCMIPGPIRIGWIPSSAADGGGEYLKHIFLKQGKIAWGDDYRDRIVQVSTERVDLNCPTLLQPTAAIATGTIAYERETLRDGRVRVIGTDLSGKKWSFITAIKPDGGVTYEKILPNGLKFEENFYRIETHVAEASVRVSVPGVPPVTAAYRIIPKYDRSNRLVGGKFALLDKKNGELGLIEELTLMLIWDDKGRVKEERTLRRHITLRVLYDEDGKVLMFCDNVFSPR